LLAAALVLAVTAAARVIGVHAPFTQKSDLGSPAVKIASTEAPARSAVPGAVASRTAQGSVDTAPTGSITPTRLNVEGVARPTPPDLSAAIPAGVAPALREAVLAGSPAAQYDLAQQLFEGRALPQDQAKAAFWFARAASAGYAPAEFRLGALYQKGVGVERDPATAKRWYQAAAEAGNARAAHNLGVIDAESVGEKADYGEAAKWFRRAAELGVRDSQYNLAVLYARGLGVNQDLRQSWLWFSLAAAQGDDEAAKKRDEVAEKMDPDARAAAADLLSKVKIGEPDPAANDPGASSAGAPDKAQPERTKPSPTSADDGAHSGL
jgi:localization factor PodJL